MKKKMKMSLTLVALAAGMAAGAAIAQNAQPPKAEPNMQKVLDAMASLKPKPIETLSPEEARKQPSAADAVKKVLSDAGQSTAPEPGVTMKTQTVQGKGGSFPVHIFTPEGNGPFPVIVYYHGGGFVIADTKVYEASIRALAKGAKAIVVSADYRQAPEHKFPTQPEDAFAAYKWAIQNAKQFNGDPMRVAVAGESAGGNLATVVSMMARDQKAQAAGAPVAGLSSGRQRHEQRVVQEERQRQAAQQGNDGLVLQALWRRSEEPVRAAVEGDFAQGLAAGDRDHGRDRSADD